MLRAFEKLENLLSWIAGISVFAMMVLVSCDAIGRYAFKSPLTFQFDFTTYYLMVIVGVLALSWGERNGAMIRINVVSRFLPDGLKGLLYALNNLLAALVFAVMTQASLKRTLETLHEGDVIFGVIDWPVWLSLVWVPIGAGVLTVRLLINAIQYGFLGRPVVPASGHEDEM
ncbi:TRAP transporter small permease [uncultured Ruegeria sp.]|uniref:TRAP transporter small permease n=1 Tax=uncultured Ruegeria sp. TaxID=259304 RepID=UPI0026381710|nr:TRAP transporter small permease [uncultured Ruegeria sp.]